MRWYRLHDGRPLLALFMDRVVALLGRKATKEWSADLPATQDYKERVEKLEAPRDLPPGFYFLVSSHDPKFGEKDNQVGVTALWVSKLSLVVRTRNGEGTVEGFVLDAQTGNPVPGATVRAWYHTNNNRRVGSDPTQSDNNGYFRFDNIDNRGASVDAVARMGQLLAELQSTLPQKVITTVQEARRGTLKPAALCICARRQPPRRCLAASAESCAGGFTVQ